MFSITRVVLENKLFCRVYYSKLCLLYKLSACLVENYEQQPFCCFRYSSHWFSAFLDNWYDASQLSPPTSYNLLSSSSLIISFSVFLLSFPLTFFPQSYM